MKSRIDAGRSATHTSMAPDKPSGLLYLADFLSPSDQARLVDAIGAMPLEHAQYKQFTAKRRVIHFGGRYDFSTQELLASESIPDVLLPLRDRIAAVAAVAPEAFSHAMVAEYRSGTQLGWHRDVPDFEIVAGLSLGSPARMQFRPYSPAERLRKHYLNLLLEPGSLYVLRDSARWGWQHRVPPVTRLRYSITFRTRRTAFKADSNTETAAGRPPGTDYNGLQQSLAARLDRK
jgi:alkylated DNA repair dioxygenase AlkB